jgi:uncharacterized protein (TIGR02246 family)
MFAADHRAKCLLLWIPFLALLLALSGCQQTPPPPAPDTRAADETAIRAAEAAQIKAVAALDAAAAVSVYTDDVVAMDAESPTIQGKENMRQWLEKFFQDKPQFSASTAQVEVARSGDLAYSRGTGTMTVKSKKGKPIEANFKYLSVWKKQADGSWKMIVDTMIPDPPAKPAAKPAK